MTFFWAAFVSVTQILYYQVGPVFDDCLAHRGKRFGRKLIPEVQVEVHRKVLAQDQVEDRRNPFELLVEVNQNREKHILFGACN